MREKIRFRDAVNEALTSFDPQVLEYDETEFWMIRAHYEYIEHFALENRLMNTALALRLARGLHNGSHRKSLFQRGGKSYRRPYVIHCLVVCRMLADLNLPLPREELDVLLAAALCHDMIEDIPFPEQGRELYKVYHLDPGVYETVKKVSKRRDFTPEEEQAFFEEIEKDKLALLIKLSDRSHNVEDLYNMSVWKMHEYIGETRKYFLPMCQYGLAHYPELRKGIEMLQDKIVILTQVSEILVDRCEVREQELLEQRRLLQEENQWLRGEYSRLWEE